MQEWSFCEVRERDGMLRGGWWHDGNGGKDENGGGVGTGAVLDEEEEKRKRRVRRAWVMRRFLMLVREGVVGSVDEDEKIRLVDWLDF